MHDAIEADQSDVAYCGWQNIGVAATDKQPQIPPDLDAAAAVRFFMENGPWPINSVLVRPSSHRRAARILRARAHCHGLRPVAEDARTPAQAQAQGNR